MRGSKLLFSLGLTLVGCAPAPEPSGPRPWILVGIDGAEWSVILPLWEEGRLPNLRALSERGTSARLATDYAKSPVIWTTVATGMRPAEHGITGFTVPTERGDAPVASSLRRVPALWNMLTAAGRRVAAVSWWASWPAEAVRGVVITDRPERDEGLWPTDLRPRWESWVADEAATPSPFPGEAGARDQATARAAVELATGGFDLLMTYFRDVDIVCHRHWKGWEPELFPGTDAEELAASRRAVVQAYEATDAAIGRIVEAAGDVNVLVASDHGFRAERPEKIRVMLDFDRLLAALGYQTRNREGVVLEQSRLFVYDSAPYQRLKKIRCVRAGRDAVEGLSDEDCAQARAGLECELARMRWDGGEPAFVFRGPNRRERAQGVDFAVGVELEGASSRLWLDDRDVGPGVVGEVRPLSGTHGLHTAGILIAAGPDVASGPALEDASIFDIAPTLLHALGLPVGEDFAGRPLLELFTDELRVERPVRVVPSWGTVEGGTVERGEGDEEWIEELRALGYLE